MANKLFDYSIIICIFATKRNRDQKESYMASLLKMMIERFKTYQDMMTPQIDFVVTWLDSSDPEWQRSFEQYSPNAKGDKNAARFRNLDCFRYWFRAVETYTPWVRKIFLITNGKFPEWINKNHPKLVLVKHEDYMPKECLPTFNSCAIELYMHKIEGLSEHFVYFNDDMFINSPIEPNYFFRNDLPCDTNKETCFNVPIYAPEERFGTWISALSNIGIVNRHFNRWQTVKQSPKKWFGLHLGFRGLIMSVLLAKQRLFVGFTNYHLEQPYLKSIFKEVWEKEPDYMNDSCSRFRQEVTANPYIFRYWQIAKNLFFPMKRKGQFYFLINEGCLNKINNALYDKNIKTICLNDSALCSEKDYLIINKGLSRSLEKKFPNKSSFEI